MEINRAIVESLRGLGLNAKELTEYIKVIEEEDNKRKAIEKKNAEVRAAREQFAESLLVYLLKLDIISEKELKDTDMNHLMRCIEELEEEILTYVVLFKAPKEELKKQKEKEKVAAMETMVKPNKIELKLGPAMDKFNTNPAKTDMNIIEDWLASLDSF